MKCGCGEYYADYIDECPECNAQNPLKSFRDEGVEADTVEHLSDSAHKAALVSIYGQKIKKHFRAMDEYWSKDKCFTEISLKLGQEMSRKMKIDQWC